MNKINLSMGIGTPIPIKGRIYLDDYFNIPKENRTLDKDIYIMEDIYLK